MFNHRMQIYINWANYKIISIEKCNQIHFLSR